MKFVMETYGNFQTVYKEVERGEEGDVEYFHALSYISTFWLQLEIGMADV